MPNTILLSADFSPDDRSGAPRVSDLTRVTFNYSDVSQAAFESATLVGSHFTGCIMDQTDFSNALLGGSTDVPGADLSYTYVTNANFRGANLYGVSFDSATVFGGDSQMNDTLTMEQVRFTNAYVAEIDFTGAIMKGAQCNGACLVMANLSGVDFSASKNGSLSASLINACLQGAIFSSTTNFADADLANAALDFAQGEIEVAHCSSLGAPEPPSPLRYSAEPALQESTMSAGTTCPNGNTLAANQQAGISFDEMLAASSPPTSWSPSSCLPSSAQMQADGIEPLVRTRSSS